MSKIVKGILAFIILVLLAGLIFYKDIPLFQSNSDAADPNTPGASPGGSSFGTARALNVDAIVAEPTELLNNVQITGEIIPNENVLIKSEINGKIDKIHFKEGEYVRAGRTLFSVNVDELYAQLEKLKITKRLRETIEARQRKLLEKEAISQEEYDQALAELQTSSADINLLETQISKSFIKAPFGGILGIREVSPGAYITPSTSLVSLYSINPAKIDFSIPGKYSNIIKVGASIEFAVESSPKTFVGKVFVIEPQIDPNTRTIKLRAICPNPNSELLPGQFANVNLVLDKKEDAILIPSEALIPEIGGSKVYLYKGGKAISTQVSTGIRTDVAIEITSGIIPGDTVITTGILQMRSGMNVNVNI